MPDVFLTIGVMQVCKGIAVALLCLAIASFTLLLVFRANRLLFRCMLVALIAHLGFAGAIWAAGYLAGRRPRKEVRVKIAGFRPLPPPPVKQPPLPERLDLPLGALNGDRKATKMPKGATLDAKKAGAPGPKTGPGRPITSGISDSGGIPVDEKDEGLFTGTFQDVIDASDIRSISSGGGMGGENAGTPEGEGSGPVPAGFPQGKIGGRVYFLRLKYGDGKTTPWNAYSAGTRKLLLFLNQYFPCESEGRAISAVEMRDKYMRKGAYPSFVYLYCDESLQLDGTEISVLREYIIQGGFLFLDSRIDLLIKDCVARELDKVLPGSPLKEIPKSHPINSTLFTLTMPGVGENTITMKNYGIARGDRLVAFYTMGNFSHLFDSNAPNAFEYITAQYQMGANVMLYAIMKGQVSGITRYKGANAEITNQALRDLGFLDSPAKTPPEPGSTIKVIKQPPANPDGTMGNSAPPDEPDDINVFD